MAGERRGVADRAARERHERIERAPDERGDRHEPCAAVAGAEQLRLRRDRDGGEAVLERSERVPAGRRHDLHRERSAREVAVRLRLVERRVERVGPPVDCDRQRPRRPVALARGELTATSAEHDGGHTGAEQRAAPAEGGGEVHQRRGS